MINRHHLRVKLLQWIFASRQQGQNDYYFVTQQFQTSATWSLRSLVMAFVLLERLIQYANFRDEERSGKLLERNRQIGPGHALANHPLHEILEKDNQYRKALQICLVEHLEVSADMLRSLFDNINRGKCIGSKLGFMEIQGITGLKVVFEKCIANGDWYHPWQLEHNLYWDSDRYLIDRQVCEILNKLAAGESFPDTETLLKSWQSDDQFASTMFKELLDDKATYQDLIEAHTGQWDSERLAKIDFLILQMACVELCQFPEIPIKVTMNEYVELAKVYSTPQSAAFVNGLLDKIKAEMLRNNMIVKSGRGLVET
jgi:N utilization substance protein B